MGSFAKSDYMVKVDLVSVEKAMGLAGPTEGTGGTGGGMD